MVLQKRQVEFEEYYRDPLAHIDRLHEVAMAREHWLNETREALATT